MPLPDVIALEEDGLHGDVEAWMEAFEAGEFVEEYNRRLAQAITVQPSLVTTEGIPTIFVGETEDEEHDGRFGGGY